MDDIPYEVTGTEKVRNLEEDLVRELTELKNELEENEILHGISRPVSSVPLPKDALHFRRERQVLISRTMEVCEARPVVAQAEVMQDELDFSLRTDYTPESLPLLLHQYFTDRIQQLVHCKHLHMLRWRRFHEHTSTIESLFDAYQDRLGYIMSEYNDCLSRAQRLSVARESYLAGNKNAVASVQVEDAVIYLRWLICHLHSMKTFHQFMREIQWLPVVHKNDVSPVTRESQDVDEASSARIPSKYQDDQYSARSPAIPSARSPSARADEFMEPSKPPPIHPNVASSNPLPSSQLAAALAASGGGLASDEDSLGLPVHVNDFHRLKLHLSHLLQLYGFDIDVSQIRTSADEMEMYGHVSRKFRQYFTRQEHFNTFRTYDKLEIGQENWGADSCMHSLKQQSNWLEYVKLKPERDPRYEKRMNELRKMKKVDELLRVMSKFFSVSNADKVQDALRDHAQLVRDPPVIQPTAATTKREKSAELWKKIYINPELYAQEKDKSKQLDAALQELEERETGQRTKGPKKARDSYDYFDAIQLLGLDEGEQDSNDPASIQGAFLSFLQLRHLRIRDLKRTSLSVFNYFRSVERTLTINDGGLSLEGGHLKNANPQNHRRSVIDGSQGGGGGLGCHQYMHYTPRDYKISESEFIEFSEVENHDDFYSVEEGRVHVQDQRGYYIMYDSAINDLESLEKDLLLVATHYIEKDRELRSIPTARQTTSSRKLQQSTAGDFDIPSYGHQEVDRFAVILDLWTHETAFLECKKELLDCYMEAYHHIFDRDEKRLMAQVITNLIHQRPRYDLQASYFLRCYRLECFCLRSKTQLMKSVLDKQISNEREYIQKVCSSGSQYGLPYKVIQKHPISVNMSRSALKNVFMLEFHPSLAFASRISAGLKHAYWELYHLHKPESVTDSIMLEKKMLECAIKDWERLPPPGSSFSNQTQRDVFSGVFVEDPVFMGQVVQKLLVEQEAAISRKSQKEKQEAQVALLGRVMEVVTLRHRLIDSSVQSEILSKIYQRQAREMGYDECHMFLRFVQFEFADHKEGAGAPPPVFITAIQEDDSMLDRYVPNCLHLAIHELDESNVGHFSFSADGIYKILHPGGVESLQAVLMAQVVHKNSLMSAVQQAHACHPVKPMDFSKSGRPVSPIDNRSEKSSTTVMTGFSSGTGATSALGTKMSSVSHRGQKSPEAFVSLQLEKAPSRDLMLNEFVSKKNSMGTILRNPAKMEETKRNLIIEYCQRFQCRVAQYSLRGQILNYYNSMMNLLEDFPEVRDKYFMFGEPNERKGKRDSPAGLEPDPSAVHERPRRVLSEDGLHVLNIHFIPHHTEVLVMYKVLDDERCRAALTYHLRIVAAIHDILQYLCAHARLGSSVVRLGSQKISVVSADWGGTEGIGSELHDIQRQIDHLDRPTSPELVSRFLLLRRDVMFLEFDAAVRHSMRDTFLATNNKRAYDAITSCMHLALHDLSNAQQPGFGAVYLNVPEPLEARDPNSWMLYPWRTFINKNGIFPVHFYQCQQIEHQVQLCLSALNDVDRHVANGEILGVSLLMEDVLLSGKQDKALFMLCNDEDDDGTHSAISSNRSKVSSARPGSRKSTADASTPNKLSRTLQPMDSFALMKSFLLLWKRLEVLKYNWGKHKLIVEAIDTPKLYKAFCIEFKKEVLYPILQSVARRLGCADMYEGLASDNEIVVTPPGASEMEIKMRLLVKLLENLECSMINDVRRKLARELNLVLSERGREESALPTDLWKKAAMKESFTINKPHIAEDFIMTLMGEAQEEGEGEEAKVIFSKAHLEDCFQILAGEVMAREKHNFESYSMYYENLLRINHQLLYQQEQEVKSLKDQIRLLRAHQQVEVQCAMADTSQSLLMEVTALRAKIAEMREMSLTQERDVRERVKEEYDALVHNLFTACFDIKKKFDEFKEDMHNDIIAQVEESKNEAKRLMRQAKYRTGTTAEEEEKSREISRQEIIKELHNKNHSLTVLLLKMKAMGQWRRNHDSGIHSRTVSELRRDSERYRKDHTRIQMLHEKEVSFLVDQLTTLRSALKVAERECDDVKRELDKELKAKKEKAHASQQRAQSQKHLEEARRANIDKLLEELDDKEGQLRILSSEQEKSSRMNQLTTNKTKKEIDSMRKQLTHERNLKLDAFQRVDELQTQVYDIESGLLGSRPQTALTCARPKSRAYSAGARHSSARVGSASNWPPPVVWPANRSITPAADLYASIHQEATTLDLKKMQRPKTASRFLPVLMENIQCQPTTGRLRSRLTEQLMNDLDPPDHHETLIKLQQMQTVQQMRENKVF